MAEQSVIGAMILTPEAILKVAEILPKGDEFYREAHRILYRAIMELFDSSVAVDVVTLTDELRRTGNLETVGGSTGLTTLIDRVPTAANVEHYAQIVKEKSVLRKLITVTTRIVSDSYADSLPVEEHLRQAEQQLMEVFNGTDKKNFDAELSDLTSHVLERVEGAKSGKRTPIVPSGFERFDARMGGFVRGGLTTIEAPPKVGKSFFMQNCMMRATKLGQKVGYIILDMTPETLMLRTLSCWMHQTIKDIQSSTVDIVNIQNAVMEIQELPLKIVGEKQVGRELGPMIRWIKYAHKRFGLTLFFVDSFTKIEIQPDRGQTDESYISKIINDFQSTAQDLDVAIVGAVDLNAEGNGKGSSRWGFGVDTCYKLALSQDRNTLKAETKYSRNHSYGFMDFEANYGWSEVREKY